MSDDAAPGAPAASPERIVAVGMCTYMRPDLVPDAVVAALSQLDANDAPGPASGLVLVVDNDPEGSGMTALAALDDPRVRIVVEPTPGIAAARQRLLDEADDAGVRRLAFIDDDELPTDDWLRLLLATMDAHGCAAVAGPVRSLFTEDADPWVVQGGFFDRAHRAGLATGARIPEAATNNLLLDLDVVRRLRLGFRTDLGLSGGEDSLFTLSLTRAGETMVWCSEALVTEVVPAERARRSWVLRRAVSMGNSRALRSLGRTASASGRARSAAGGAARAALGTGWAAYGLARGNVHAQGRGVRTALTGVGMLLGSAGFSYREYTRDGHRIARVQR